ncbi:MAG: SprT family protein [Streptococcaceae bacterium]|jgi:SprT-like protein|nr:SprT family protein [Streptococcaceae bacterium]
MLELEDYVRQVSLEDFGWAFEHQAVWNKRLKTTGGTFYPKALHLAFNPLMYQHLTLQEFRQIVRHELCHYHLFRQGLGYKHRDSDFKQLLKQVDGLRFAPKVIMRSHHLYRCQNCQAKLMRIRRVDTKKYRCGACLGELKLEQILEA